MTARVFLSVFEREEDILRATRQARESGLEIVDVYTPYAVHGLDEAMGVKPTLLPWVCLGLGITGAALKFWFQMWTSATSWPVNVGGKPLRSVPAFVPVTFEIMVLFAGIGTVIAFFIVRRLRPGKRAQIANLRVSDDRFVLALLERDATFDVGAMRERMMALGAVETEERLTEVAR
jgi:hypothetical protein